MKKKLGTILALVLVCGMLLGTFAGCGGPGNSDTPSGSTNPGQNDPQSSQEPTGNKMRETLTLGSTNLWETLTPFRSTAAQSFTYVRHLYDRLAYFTGDGKYVPQGAKSWTVADDGVTYHVELYDYISDSAGNHITADDVVWVIEENMARGLKPCFNKVDHVEKTGDYTFDIVMKADVVDMVEMVLESTYVFSRKAFEASSDEFATSVISTSPYLVTDYVSGSHITFTLRDDYWQSADLIDPTLANNAKVVTYQYITEASQQQIALESGTIDAMISMASTSVQNFEGNDAYVLVTGAGGNGIQMFFSGADSKIVANDLNLRNAICYALDIDGIIAAAYSGYAEPMHDMVPRTNTGYLAKWDSEEYFGYNVERAKEYLAASSYKGEKLSLLALTSANRLAQMIQSYLGAVGIDLELNVCDAAQYSASQTDGNNYDIILVPGGNGSMVALWANRLDGNSYPLGDATSRKDDTLTNMLYSTWTNTGFTEENIDAVHRYITDNAYAYGIVLPLSTTVYDAKLNVESIITSIGSVDLVAATYR